MLKPPPVFTRCFMHFADQVLLKLLETYWNGLCRRVKYPSTRMTKNFHRHIETDYNKQICFSVNAKAVLNCPSILK